MERKQIYKTYSVEEALEKIFEPGSDSEMSGDNDIVLDETEGVISVKERIGDESEDEDILPNESEEDISFRVSRVSRLSLPSRMNQENESEGNVENPSLPADLQSVSIESCEHVYDEQEKEAASRVDVPADHGIPKDTKFDLTKYSNHNYRWRSIEPPVKDTNLCGPEIPLPPENFDQLTPLNYFQMFWGQDLDQLIADQTNLYSTQLTAKSIGVTANEIRQMIGIQMLMAVVKLPQYDMYWAKESRYPPVADAMSIKRYKELRRFLHVSDNSKKDEPENKGNKLYKIEPVLLHVRDNCRKIQSEVENSIDEQIIPAKTSHSGIRLYNPKKAKKWGFKNFVRAGASGFMYDFFLYQGKSTSTETINGASAVLKLIETLPRVVHFRLFFDNWFTSFPLALTLKQHGYLINAVVRSDRIQKCPLLAVKDLRRKGRGSHDWRTDNNSGITVTKWYDNKSVHILSTYHDPKATEEVTRWDRKQKKTYQDRLSCNYKGI